MVVAVPVYSEDRNNSPYYFPRKRQGVTGKLIFEAKNDFFKHV